VTIGSLPGSDNTAAFGKKLWGCTQISLLSHHGTLHDSITSLTALWVSGEIMFSVKWNAWCKRKKKEKKKELIKSPLAINIIILEKVGSQGFQPVSSSWASLFWQ